MTMWYPESEASSHVTYSSNNIANSSPYRGHVSITAANGNSMKISHLGNSLGSASGHNFYMNDVLLISKASKNLLLVNRLCNDNNVRVEFDAQKVTIYDRELLKKYWLKGSRRMAYMVCL